MCIPGGPSAARPGANIGFGRFGGVRSRVRLLAAMRRHLVLSSTLFLAACGDSAVQTGLDASSPVELGSSRDVEVGVDAEEVHDAGFVMDAGDLEIGPADRGLDAGADLGTDLGTDLGLDFGVDLGPDASDDCEAPHPPVSNPNAPPYSGTLFIDPNIITEADPSSFAGLSYAGQGSRTMYDRRTSSFNVVNAHLFDAAFGSGTQIEIQVNPEFNQAEAEVEATYYATAIGRLPGFLFADLQTVWIHRGLQPFGGGNNNLLIHTEQGQQYALDGLLEETFLHEASHTSMDSHHAATARWIEAQTADGTFLSTYARDNPTREDVAETLGPYLAVRFRASRVDATVVSTILSTVPNRIRYLDCLGLSMDLLP